MKLVFVTSLVAIYCTVGSAIAGGSPIEVHTNRNLRAGGTEPEGKAYSERKVPSEYPNDKRPVKDLPRKLSSSHDDSSKLKNVDLDLCLGFEHKHPREEDEAVYVRCSKAPYFYYTSDKRLVVYSDDWDDDDNDDDLWCLDGYEERLTLWPCRSYYRTQRWSPRRVSNGVYRFKNRASGLYLGYETVASDIWDEEKEEEIRFETDYPALDDSDSSCECQWFAGDDCGIPRKFFHNDFSAT